jgi:hypothetical protein
MRWLGVMAVMGVLLAGCGGVSQKEGDEIVKDAFANELEMVALYCIYGSTSEAQYDGCVRNVEARYVEHSHSNAAEWAKGNRTTCGYDSGPQCGAAGANRIDEKMESIRE